MMVISKRLRSHDMWVKLFLKITYSHLYLPIYPSIETIIISGSKCTSQLKTCEKILLDYNYPQCRYILHKFDYNLVLVPPLYPKACLGVGHLFISIFIQLLYNG